MLARNRIAVMNGVNLDQLGRRDPAHYGGMDYDRLVEAIAGWCSEMGLEPSFFQSNFEGEFVEHLHKLDGIADGVLLNPGAWTHYSWAIRDALEIAALPAVEVHLSDVSSREEFRRLSVVSDLCLATVQGQGPEGYREALGILRDRLSEGA